MEENIGKTLHMRECSRLLSLDDNGSTMKIKISKFSFPGATLYILGGTGGNPHNTAD